MKVVIYQTSDMHGYVYPTNYVEDMPLGILRVGSYMLKDQEKYDASIKVDCGDLIQGSPLTHYLHKHNIKENPIMKGMASIGYDIYTLGNHEFNYGKDYLNNSYKDVQEKIVNANIEGLELETKPYKILDYDGFKIAFIGLTTKFIPNWEQPENIEGYSINDPVLAYQQYEEELKNNADYIIVCYHGGFEKSVDESLVPTEKMTGENQGSELLEKFDSIDIILSGHQHRTIISKVKDVICSQPMNNGQAVTKIVIDTKTKELTYDLIYAQDMSADINPELETIFTKTQSDLLVYLNSVVGHFNEEILVSDVFDARLNGHALVNFVHEVQLEASGADISAVQLVDSTIGFKKDVTIRDVLINYPYPNTLKVLEITGHKIKEAIEKSATYFVVENDEATINPDFLIPKVQNYNYDMYGGLEYVVDLNKPFYERVIEMKFNGRLMDLEKVYKIVVNNYRATNTSVYPCYENAKVIKEVNVDVSELLINYIQQKKSVEVKNKSNYKFIW